MISSQVRTTFLEFFKSKGHEIVPSAPMVVKNDPTLMFNNSGMAPFKDLFLGNAPIRYPRVADTQKCLRVSGKHNDLEEVGVDTYHHTMFEMLGNWSFGDYFKKEAISWAWELLTEIYKIDKDRLYVTVFEGDEQQGIPFDQEAFEFWKSFVSEDRILMGNKKDNFWEMGDTGPCGPCSEIHYDARNQNDRNETSGRTLVNTGHPQVIEIWNNVFMEYERRASGELTKLPKKHVDTGMGFERLCMVLQKKSSTYDTDVFTPLIEKIEELCGQLYKPHDEEHHKNHRIINIAMRVIADHIRAISFAIADGQLPSATGAGYVIRRILRRAIRYGYQSLGLKDAFLYRLVPVLAAQMGEAFPELNRQKLLIEKVIHEEENSFFKTLEVGLRKIDMVCMEMAQHKSTEKVNGKIVFELYDTFGFPADLTALIAKGYQLEIDEEGFQSYLDEQRKRSKDAIEKSTADWTYTAVQWKSSADKPTEFVGYESTDCDAYITRFRKVTTKNKELFQLVLNQTPFYAESGGQKGDSGFLERKDEKVEIINTIKENGVIIHVAEKLPQNIIARFHAVVNKPKRRNATNNHSATHLLHAALRKVLGTHVEQKGSLVTEEYLRFDFSHFSKMTEEEIANVEKMVNDKIRENIKAEIRTMTLEDAKNSGAMALFGEKYGDVVRVVAFDKSYSIELCGGTHVNATGEIGLFKITAESAIAAGVRRIEAISSEKALQYYQQQENLLSQISETLQQPKDIIKSVQQLLDEKNQLQKQLDSIRREKAVQIKKELLAGKKSVNGMNVITSVISLDSAEEIKNMLFEIRNQVDNLFCVIGSEINGKASLSVMLSDNLVSERKLNAGSIVKIISKEIQGGGGGQSFYATAGGTNPQGLKNAIEKAQEFLN
jgi:alanyl-tRNA synthetase